MSFYKIVNSEGHGIKLLGDVPATASTGDFLVWSYDYSSSPPNWEAANGVKFQSWSGINANLVKFQVNTIKGKNHNLLTAYEGIDAANPLTSYRIENYNKFRTLHNNDLAIVEINTRLAKGAMGENYTSNANILIEYRKANPDGTIAEDNYLKLQQDSLHSNPIETNNFNIGFEGDLKVHKHAEIGTTKIAVWDENGVLQKSTFDPGTGGTPLPDAVEHRMLHGSRIFNQNIPSTWVTTNNLFYEEYADDGMDTLWTLSNSSTANTNSTFNYSTIREHLTNYGLKSYFDMETIKGGTDSRAVLASTTEVSNFTDNTSSSKTTYSIYDDEGESHLTIGVDSKRDFDIDASNWSILHDGGLKVNEYYSSTGEAGEAYWDSSGVLRRRDISAGNNIIHGQHRFQISTDNTSDITILRSEFRYIPNIRYNTNPLYDILKNINVYLIRNGVEYLHLPRHILSSDRLHIFFDSTLGMNGEELDIRFTYDPIFPAPTGGPQA